MIDTATRAMLTITTAAINATFKSSLPPFSFVFELGLPSDDGGGGGSVVVLLDGGVFSIGERITISEDFYKQISQKYKAFPKCYCIPYVEDVELFDPIGYIYCIHVFVCCSIFGIYLWIFISFCSTLLEQNLIYILYR